jgi:hypothetical protein
MATGWAGIGSSTTMASGSWSVIAVGGTGCVYRKPYRVDDVTESLKLGNDRATVFRPGDFGLAIQVEDPDCGCRVTDDANLL